MWRLCMYSEQSFKKYEKNWSVTQDNNPNRIVHILFHCFGIMWQPNRHGNGFALSTRLRPKGLRRILLWCGASSCGLSLPVQLQKEPLCPGVPVFGKESELTLSKTVLTFPPSRQILSQLLLQWQTLGKAAWIKISTLHREKYVKGLLRPKDTWLLEPRFPYLWR